MPCGRRPRLDEVYLYNAIVPLTILISRNASPKGLAFAVVLPGFDSDIVKYAEPCSRLFLRLRSGVNPAGQRMPRLRRSQEGECNRPNLACLSL